MSKPVQRLYTAGQVRDLDRIAIEDLGIDAFELMKRAGLVGYRVLRYRFPHARRIAVCCGSGNNGGDGYVLAATALRAGLWVRVVALAPPKSGTARQAMQDFEAAGGSAQAWDDGPFGDADAIVDALLGTGLERAPGGAYASVIESMNSSGRPVVALDVPSGLNGDTGKAFEPCVRAAATVSFIGRKIGCFTSDGRARAGRLYFDDLNVPDALYERIESTAALIEPERFASFIGGRSPTAHKGDAGRVLIAGGNHGMPGAPCLAARAAHVSGAGLVYLATRSRPEDLVANTLESIAVEAQSPPDLGPVLTNADIVAVGPGLGRDQWAQDMWRALRSSGLPMVVDADALHLLARTPEKRADWILTPHPGEAASLLGTTTAGIQADRIAAVRALKERYGGVIVLKGSGTLVLGASIHLCDLGNAGMASAGMGDVLTGIVAALRGQGMSAEDAACYGVWCHARAGDLAAKGGLVGLTAGALTEALRDVVGQ